MQEASNRSQAPFDAVAVLRQRLDGFQPRVALVLGSGLGDLADAMADAVAIPYLSLIHISEPTRPY